MGTRKLALIGAGQIGGTAALLAGLRGLGDIVLYDVLEGLPQGKALDLSHLAPLCGGSFRIHGTSHIADIAGADVCLVTSGVPRKPGMSRDDLAKTNAAIVRGVAEAIREHAPGAFVVVVTNPLDAMAHLTWQTTGFPAERVVGMAGLLDTARYQAFLAEALHVSPGAVSAMVLGGHGDDMVPLRSCTACGGIPVERLLAAADLDAIERRVRGAGGEIVALLKTGSAFCSPAAAAVQMLESYLLDQKRLLTGAALCRGEYGIKDIYLGVPIVIGAGGVERIVEIELSPRERQQLEESAARVRDVIRLL